MFELLAYAANPILAQSGGGNIFSYFEQANTAGKVIVLLLVISSILAWTVMLGKYLDLRRLRMINRTIDARIEKIETLLGSNPAQRLKSPYASVITSALNTNSLFKDRRLDKKTQIGLLENAIQRAVSVGSNQYESKMVLLGSIVTAAPFLGLLGTVCPGRC